MDRVNNPGSSRLELPPPPLPAVAATEPPIHPLADSINNAMNLELNEAYNWESKSTASTPSEDNNDHESSPRPFRELNRGYYEERTLPAKEQLPLPDVVSGRKMPRDQ